MTLQTQMGEQLELGLDLVSVPDVHDIFDTRLWLDIMDAAAERGITARQLVFQAVTNDLFH